jgi:hypothetical protein
MRGATAPRAWLHVAIEFCWWLDGRNGRQFCDYRKVGKALCHVRCAHGVVRSIRHILHGKSKKATGSENLPSSPKYKSSSKQFRAEYAAHGVGRELRRVTAHTPSCLD